MRWVYLAAYEIVNLLSLAASPSGSNQIDDEASRIQAGKAALAILLTLMAAVGIGLALLLI